jgi:hypothetical protein
MVFFLRGWISSSKSKPTGNTRRLHDHAPGALFIHGPHAPRVRSPFSSVTSVTRTNLQGACPQVSACPRREGEPDAMKNLRRPRRRIQETPRFRGVYDPAASGGDRAVRARRTALRRAAHSGKHAFFVFHETFRGLNQQTRETRASVEASRRATEPIRAKEGVLRRAIAANEFRR